MKLMPACGIARHTEYAAFQEFHRPIPQGQTRLLHDSFSGKQPDHLMRCACEVADGLREIHHPTTFCIDRPAPLSKLPDCCSHCEITSQHVAMQFRIASAEIQHIHV